jgi:predicted transcriptional regulator
MSRHKSKIFSERELEIMNALWDLGKAPVRAIRDRMGGKKAGAYTSVATMLKFLENKGAVRHRIVGRAYQFEPRISRERAGAQALRFVLRGFFRNSPQSLIETLVSKERLSETQKEEILSIVKNAETR